MTTQLKRLCTLGLCTLGLLLLTMTSAQAAYGSKGRFHFTPGSISSANNASNTHRWYFASEGGIGTSYTWLGREQLNSLDFTYAAYIKGITKFAGFSPVFGVEFNIPIYLNATHGSNIYPDKYPAASTQKFYSTLGAGLEVPLIIGLQWEHFYIQGLVGYTYSYIQHQYTLADGSHPNQHSSYHGLIYGGGLGFRFANILNIGARYTTGALQNFDRGGSDVIASPVSHNFYKRMHKASVYISLTF